MSTAKSTASLASDIAPMPSYMRSLVARAALLLDFHGHDQCVRFTWWADGEETQYMARVKWMDGESGPRVLVVRGRSGEFVCRSLPGQLFDIDSSCLGGGADEDELDRLQWEQHRSAGEHR